MTTPASAMLAQLLSMSPLHSEECHVLIDGEAFPGSGRFPSRYDELPVGSREMKVRKPRAMFYRDALPRMLVEGDLVERADGSVWTIVDPMELETGSVECVLMLSAP